MSLDLTAIKARRNSEYRETHNAISRSILLGAAIADIDALLLEVERLQLIEQAYKLSLAVDKYAKEIGELE